MVWDPVLTTLIDYFYLYIEHFIQQANSDIILSMKTTLCYFIL